MEEMLAREPLSALLSRELLSTIIDATSALVVVLDRDGRILLFNRACERLTGYSFEEVKGTCVWDRLLVPEEINAVKGVFRELAAGNFPNEHENAWVTREGRRRWIHWENTALAGDGGSVRYVIGTGIDITARRQAEEAGRQFTAIVESSADAIFSVALDGTILTWNPGAERIFGYTAHEAIGREINLIFPGGIDDTAQALERVERGERVEYFDVPRVCKDGRTIYVSLTIAPIRNASGEVVATSRTARDITAQKQMEAALRESETRLRKLAVAVEQSPSTVIITDAEGRIEYVNPRFTQLTGYTLEEVRGQNPRILKSGATSPQEYEHLWQTVTAGGEWRGTFCNRKKNGERYWESTCICPIHDGDGKITHFLAVKEDITEYKRLQERFHRVVDAAPNGLVLVDAEGKIVLANREIERLFGYRPEELIGQPVEQLVPERLRRHHREHRQGFMREGQARVMGAGRELFARRRDGSEFPVEIGLSPVDTEEGRLVIAAIADITARRQAEHEAKRRLEELAHVSRVSSISQVASGLAHELNQPLTAIVSYAEACRLMLRADGAGSELVSRSLVDIIRQGERASEIISRLREFVRKGEVERSGVDVNALVENVLELLRHELVAHGIQVRLALEQQLAPITASRVQIEQVVFNLVRNAIDAMRASATRTLAVQTVSMHGERPAVAVAVSDSGEGLSPESSERLFDAFFSTKPEGMGLGLSICRTIVEAHGGRIWVTANDHGGTTFHFTLPLESALAR